MHFERMTLKDNLLTWANLQVMLPAHHMQSDGNMFGLPDPSSQMKAVLRRIAIASTCFKALTVVFKGSS